MISKSQHRNSSGIDNSTQQNRREEAIEYFKRTHGDHSHEVIPMLDIDAFVRVAMQYKGRVDFSQYPIIAAYLAEQGGNVDNMYSDVCNKCHGSGHSPEDDGECPDCNGYGCYDSDELRDDSVTLEQQP
ncbi:hypothetical protein [Erwinia sp. S38]|uniref:hypothetical protein n=1 Tax=Erwinia sp. S38 TaxID=2769338 RepID=UPI0019094B64|nr:hypothetical protein [Erwinia sp. S38]MBK0004733.1 hypothetical protein [Erwinia sp. S38]